MVSTSQGAAAATVLCLIGVATWAFLSEFPLADPGRPSTKAEPLVVLEASVPAIGEFAEFNINDQNPFIPSQLRSIEVTRIRAPKVTTGKVKPPPTVEVPPTPSLPRLPAPGLTAPAATGVIIAKGVAQALVTFPGNDHAELMQIGDSSHGWKLTAINDGNLLLLQEIATGAILPLAVPVTDASENGVEKPATPAGKATGDHASESKKGGGATGSAKPATAAHGTDKPKGTDKTTSSTGAARDGVKSKRKKPPKNQPELPPDEEPKAPEPPKKPPLL